jgi:hypothetical protein
LRTDGRIGEVGDFQIFGYVGFAVSGCDVAGGAIVAVDLLAFGDGLGSGVDGAGLARVLDGNRVIGRLGSGLGFLG